MPHYAIGDIQGCYAEFMRLLEKIHFNDKNDTLWIAGDLINGGYENCDVLRFLSHLPIKPIVVLGNHDLHFLAVYYGVREIQPDDTFQDILESPDTKETKALVTWLQSQSLAYYDAKFNALMIHAGISPTWSLEQTLSYAKAIENCLNPEKNNSYNSSNIDNIENIHTFLLAIFGISQEEKPKHWRLITDTLTRSRFCDAKGNLNLDYKGNIANAPSGLHPWFQSTQIKCDILFGHWAALEGKINSHYLTPNIYPLDTGCVWGGKLSALRLEDKQLFQVEGKKYR